jgi:DNA ligase 1
MLFADLVATSQAVAATPKRAEKIGRLAELLRRLERDEIAVAVAFLSGELPTGRIGIGWSTLVRAQAAGSAAAPELAIGDVVRFLDEVLATVGEGSAAHRSRRIAALFARATAPEGDFLARLLVGELRQGALAGVMSDAIAKAASVPAQAVRRAAMLTGDLALAAQIALGEGEPGLAALSLEVGRPVLPMLASTSADPAAALAATGEASVEWKIDGARVQVHRWAGDHVRIFTRNLNDVTDRLPELVAIARSLDVSSAVLDGEVLGLDEEEAPRAFQDTMSRFSRAELGALRPYFFDVLHLDGEILIDRPLRERLPLLDRAVGALAVPRIATADAAEAERFLAGALAAGHEGVMVKALDGRYEAGRRGKSWRKVKPVLTLDLVVLAAEWGHGRRRAWLSNLHLGARDPETGGFVMVGKTFKGLTDELLRWQTERFTALAEREADGTVWVRPECVVEIALDGVQRSTRYPGGVALRFARIRGYRPDREPASANTIDEVRALLPGATRQRP